MKKLAFATLFAVSSVPAFAALAPYYQSAREIQTILQNDEVIDRIGVGATVDAIIRRGDFYYVRAARCTLPVEVVSLPASPGIVGAQKFKLRVGLCH